MKLVTKLKPYYQGWTKTFIYYSVILIGAELIGLTILTVIVHAALNCNNPYPIAEVTVPRAKAETELSMRDYVLMEWGKVGQRKNAEAIIDCESHFNNNTFNINSNKTIDLGLYQFNSVHIKSGLITLEEIGDYKKSTKKAIEMWQKKGWSPWVCAKLLNIK